LRPGVVLEVVTGDDERAGGPRPCLEVVARLEDGQVLVTSPEGPHEVAERWGVMPLPPYIRRNPRQRDRQRDLADRERYQTVFAAGAAGSVAAPTAGLHFSDETLRQLAKAEVGLARVSLHVGPGTFRPPSPEQVARGRLHREFFHLPAAASAAVDRARRAGGRIIAVGTTSLRVLETVARLGLDAAGPDRRRFGPTADDPDPVFTGEAVRRGDDWEVRGDTRLFLRPPTPVVAVDGLLTNFHLPGSSLLMLVAAVAGEDIWPLAYDHAVRNRMRFYSYGDCMLILPGLSGPAESR
jgi:S-adenosylmethionine:tRNA ribosyltransferase-isomerase